MNKLGCIYENAIIFLWVDVGIDPYSRGGSLCPPEKSDDIFRSSLFDYITEAGIIVIYI